MILITLVAGANLALVLLVRRAVARALGPRAGPFWSRSGEGDPVSASRQALFVLAGIMAGYGLLASLFAASYWLGGKVVSDPDELDTTVLVMEGRAAEAAGVLDGDRIVSLGGVETRSCFPAGARGSAPGIHPSRIGGAGLRAARTWMPTPPS